MDGITSVILDRKQLLILVSDFYGDLLKCCQGASKENIELPLNEYIICGADGQEGCFICICVQIPEILNLVNKINQYI